MIGIAGCSGSGKTTLARELARQLDATLFPMDLYYRDLSQFPLDSREKRNFDHPDSLESELIVEHVRGAGAGRGDRAAGVRLQTHARVAGSFETITPAGVVIVEGILALHYAELVACYGFSIYVNAPQEVCLARRIERDMRERGRTEESVRAQLEATTRPMAELYRGAVGGARVDHGGRDGCAGLAGGADIEAAARGWADSAVESFVDGSDWQIRNFLFPRSLCDRGNKNNKKGASSARLKPCPSVRLARGIRNACLRSIGTGGYFQTN